MSSPLPAWPATLPPAALVAGLQYQPAANATPIPVEAGELLTRRRFTGEMARIQGSANLTTEQAQTLLAFYRTDLQETLPFTWDDPLTGESVEMVFEGPPQFQALSTSRWQASFTLLTKPTEPTGSP
jgi:hypothetical protein